MTRYELMQFIQSRCENTTMQQVRQFMGWLSVGIAYGVQRDGVVRIDDLALFQLDDANLILRETEKVGKRIHKIDSSFLHVAETYPFLDMLNDKTLPVKTNMDLQQLQDSYKLTQNMSDDEYEPLQAEKEKFLQTQVINQYMYNSQVVDTLRDVCNIDSKDNLISEEEVKIKKQKKREEREKEKVQKKKEKIKKRKQRDNAWLCRVGKHKFQQYKDLAECYNIDYHTLRDRIVYYRNKNRNNFELNGVRIWINLKHEKNVKAIQRRQERLQNHYEINDKLKNEREDNENEKQI